MPSDLDSKRIAIVRMSAIGDVVHTLPLIASLRAAAPAAHISWIIQPTPHELVRHHRGVDEFILFTRKPLAAGYRSLRRRLKGRRFDVVLVPQTSLKAAVTVGMIEAPRKVGFDRGRAPELGWLFTNERLQPRPPGHVQEEALEFADHLGVPRRLAWDIGPTPEEIRRYSDLLPAGKVPAIALSVASSRREKDWPADRFAELVRRLAAAGARPILVGGLSEAEDRAAAEVRRLAGVPVLDLRAWDLRRLVFLLHAADAFVGPDSGPLHVAAALGTPSVALMGFTNPARFGPTRFRELMVDAFSEPGEPADAAAPPRPGRMPRITVDQVEERVRRALGPAYRRDTSHRAPPG